MTSDDPEEVVTAISDGITVEKSFEPDDFPVPAIAFVVVSDRNEPVSIRLVDTVPENVSPENVGFHPKYGAEFWDVEGELIVFEREFAAGEEYTTVYGLRGGGADIATKFMGVPRLESVDPPLEDEAHETSPEEGEGVEDSADIEDIDLSTPDDDSSEADTESPIEETATTTEGVVDSDETSDDEISAESLDEPTQKPSAHSTVESTRSRDERLLSELAGEIRAAGSDDSELAALREALGHDPVRASVETRIDHLQSAVADLEAYTEALEAFLDENGEAQQLIDDVRSEYEETSDRLDSVEVLAEDAAESTSGLEERFEYEIDEIERLESDIASLSSELSEVTEMRTRLASALGGLTEEPPKDSDDI